MTVFVLIDTSGTVYGVITNEDVAREFSTMDSEFCFVEQQVNDYSAINEVMGDAPEDDDADTWDDEA